MNPNIELPESVRMAYEICDYVRQWSVDENAALTEHIRTAEKKLTTLRRDLDHRRSNLVSKQEKWLMEGMGGRSALGGYRASLGAIEDHIDDLEGGLPRAKQALSNSEASQFSASVARLVTLCNDVHTVEGELLQMSHDPGKGQLYQKPLQERQYASSKAALDILDSILKRCSKPGPDDEWSERLQPLTTKLGWSKANGSAATAVPLKRKAPPASDLYANAG